MSENQYPTYNQLQSPEDFTGPKHKLSRILPPGQTPTILPSHSSNPSWKNEQSFSPKNIVSTSDYYSRNFLSDVHKNYKEELSLWSNSPHSKTDIKDSKLNTLNIFSTDEQQESMDLSSHPSIQSSKSPYSPKVMPINGDMSRKQLSKNVNGEMKVKKSDTESESTTTVIASNSVNSKEFRNRTISPKSKKGGTGFNSQQPINISEIILSKRQIISSDNVESVLETMFYSDTKFALPTSTITSNPAILKESVEKPIQLSPEAALELTEKSDNENKTSLERFSRVHPQASAISVKCSCDKNPVLLKNETKIVNFSLGVEESLSTARKLGDSECKIKSVNRIEISSPGNNGKEDSSNRRSTAQDKEQQDTSTTNEKGIIKNEEQWGNTKRQTGISKSEVREDTLKIERGELKTDEISYVEVESELAKMFAGIEDASSNKIELVSSQSLPIDAPDSMTDPCQSSPHINPVEESSYQPADLSNNISIVRKSNKKKSSKKSKSNNLFVKNSKTKHTSGVKENIVMDNTITKRVPVIHIEGSKESPINVQIINSIKVEEEDSTDHKTSVKRKAGKSDKAFKRIATDYVLKNYDPCTSDASWICIFCNLSAYSPWISGEPSGDLFGPYFIRDVNCTNTIDIARQFRMSDQLDQLNQVKKKQKRSLSVESDYLDSSSAEQKAVEIWAHENCFVWAPGVHLVGSKLIGIEEAVWDALKTTCSHCGVKGASIGCRARHCKTFTHYGCAVFSGWKLDSKTFISTCNIHKVAN